MKTFPIALMLVFMCLFSCSKEENIEETNNLAINIGVPIKLVNKAGQNLLEPSTPNYYKAENIKKYDLIDGKEQLFYKSNWSSPYGFSITKNPNLTYINVRANTESKENPTTTYIDWGNGDRDTLVCKMTKTNDGYYQFIQELWINGEKVFEGKPVDNIFTIVK
jgi:hypothetical protein